MVIGITLIVVFLLVVVALVYFKLGNKYLLLLILLQNCFLASKNINKPYLNEWDEMYHALVAKNLTHDLLKPTLYKQVALPYNYKEWNKNHIWLHKPPLSLWVMSGSIAVFGNNEFAVRFPSFIFALLSIFLSFLIFQNLFDLKTALLVAYFQSISGFLLELSVGLIASDHVDTLFLFLIELGVFSFVYFDRLQAFRKKNYAKEILLLGLITAWALLTKWITGFFILLLYGTYLHLLTNQKPITILLKLLFSSLLSIIVASIWYYYAYVHYTKEFLWEQLYNFKHFNHALEGHAEAWWYFIDNARIRWNELIYLIFIYFIYKSYKERFQAKYVFILIWVSVPYILFSFAKTKMPAYIVISAPAIFCMMAIFCQGFWNNFANSKYRIFYKLLPICVFALSIRYCIERVKPFRTFENDQLRKTSILNLGKHLVKDKPNIIFGNDDSIRFMFYLDCTSYNDLPSLNIIEKLAIDYHIIVVDNGRLPDELRINSKLSLVKLQD